MDASSQVTRAAPGPSARPITFRWHPSYSEVPKVRSKGGPSSAGTRRPSRAGTTRKEPLPGDRATGGRMRTSSIHFPSAGVQAISRERPSRTRERRIEASGPARESVFPPASAAGEPSIRAQGLPPGFTRNGPARQATPERVSSTVNPPRSGSATTRKPSPWIEGTSAVGRAGDRRRRARRSRAGMRCILSFASARGEVHPTADRKEDSTSLQAGSRTGSGTRFR